MEEESRKYGSRWIAAETVFSSIKRTYGEYVSAIKYQNKNFIVEQI